MSGLNVLLGGEGLIGKALDRHLRTLGEETVVYDLKSGFDLRSSEPDNVPDDTYYWFLAWDVGGAKYIMEPSAQVPILVHNLELCKAVFGWLERRKDRFTFTSTQMVGYPNAYGLTKSIGEYWTNMIATGLVARLWNVYDAEEPSLKSHVVADLVQQGATRNIRLQTDGRERRQFLHADDCARALVIQRDLGQALADITSGEWLSICDLASTIADLMRADLEVGSASGYETLIEPVHHLPGWAPAIDLRTGIARVIEKMRSKGWC